MTDGKIALQGTPKDVFSMWTPSQPALDVPQVTALSHRLRSGLNLPDGIITVDELVECLCQS